MVSESFQTEVMSKATVSKFIDRYHPKQNGECTVSIRVTYQRTKKYYPTALSLTPEFWDIMITEPKRKHKDVLQDIQRYENKAVEIKESLEKSGVFTFGLFEDRYLGNDEAGDSVSKAFDSYIKELMSADRIGTAVSYRCAKNSLESFKKGLRFAEINKQMLEKYEEWMLKSGKSISSVGIYLRSLRTILNRARIDRSLYPFGSGKNLYEIPTSKNIKKALNLTEVAQIFNYKTDQTSTKAMARDYWIFIYLCNGINVKDLCLLKRKNIEGDTLKYLRAKTKRSKKDQQQIVVSLKPQAKEVISRWGQPSVSPESYVFPHLRRGMTAEVERATYQQLTKTINKYMKLIAKELGINKDVTTYFARHSFATILRNSGASIEFISEALGHSDSKTTQSYLKGFPEDQIHSTTDALLKFN